MIFRNQSILFGGGWFCPYEGEKSCELLQSDCGESD